MYLCNGQKVVGQFYLLPFHLSVLDRIFTSLDDFIDARLGRKPANIHLHLFDSAPNSAPASSGPSTTVSAPPDSPTLASKSLMSDGTDPITPTQQTKHAQFASASGQRDVPQSAQDPLSRSARIRAFRAFQHASPEERERIRAFGLGAASTDNRDDSAARTRGEWTAVHLLSADEVKSLFKDVVEGLRFLVYFFFLNFIFCFTSGSNLCVCGFIVA